MDLISIVVAIRSLDQENQIRNNLGSENTHEIILVAGKCPSLQRNKGVESATGDIIYFLDDDSMPGQHVFEKAESIFADDRSIAVIGGPAITLVTDTFMQRTFAETLGTIWATGKSFARYKKAGKKRFASEKEMILCNMFVRKEAFEKLNGFNENLYPNEENEFLNRLKNQGYKIIYDPDIYVSRSHRDTIKDFFIQCFTYGRGRAEQVIYFFAPGDIINFIPAFFVVYLIFVNIIRNNTLLIFPLYLYIALTCFFSAKASIFMKNVLSFFIFLFEFPMVHIAYGCGTIYGFFLHLAFRKRKTINRQIEIKIM